MWACAERSIANSISSINNVSYSKIDESNPIYKFARYTAAVVSSKDLQTSGKKELSTFSEVEVIGGSPAIYHGGDVSYGANSSQKASSRAYSNAFEVKDSEPVAIPGTEDPSGISANINLEGSLISSFGKDSKDGKSILMDCAGSMISWFGQDSNGRSIVTQTDGAVIMEIGNPDKNDVYNAASTSNGSLYLRVNVTSKGTVDKPVDNNNGETDDYLYLKFQISASGFDEGAYITSSLLPFYNDDMWSVMLTRKAGADRTDGLPAGSEITNDKILSQSVYEVTTKQYDSTRQRVINEDTQSLTSHTASLASDVNNITGSKLNASFTGSGHVYLGGLNTGFGARFTGSLMEYRLWSEPLSASAFDNHTRTPKAYNGNTYSSSYESLLTRYELNDNVNLQSTPTASNTAHLKTYENHSADVNGFTGNFFRSIVDQEQIRVPKIGSTRRNATKIRIENNTLTSQLNPDISKEVSSQDFAPIDSEKLGIYLSPTDVVNEDIIYSLADFDFDDFIWDPRDEFEYSYRTLEQKRLEYFKRYFGSNSFWDYMRILTYYDSSVFRTLKQFIPARAKPQFGTLIEPNILERTKEVIGKKPSTTQPYDENAGQFEPGLAITSLPSGSDNVIKLGGTFPLYESVLVFNTGSRGTNIATLVKIDQLNPDSAEPDTYATASVTFGGEGITFGEVLSP